MDYARYGHTVNTTIDPDAKMDSFDFTGLENAADSQVENEGKEINFVLEHEGQIQRGKTSTPRRLVYSIISSGSLLKCVASAAGLWTGSKYWNFVSILVTFPLIVLVLIGEAVAVFFCKQDSVHINNTFCHKTGGDLSDLGYPSRNMRFINICDFLVLQFKYFASWPWVSPFVEAVTSRMLCPWSKPTKLLNRKSGSS